MSSQSISHRVFLSTRFNESKPQATLLKHKLEQAGVSTFLCDVPEGQNIAKVVMKAIDQCELVVIFGTSTYGKETDCSFSTAQELRYIVDHEKPFFLIKMCEMFLEPAAKFHLPPSIAYYQWDERVDPSDDLVRKIVTRLAAINASTSTSSHHHHVCENCNGQATLYCQNCDAKSCEDCHPRSNRVTTRSDIYFEFSRIFETF